MMSKFFPKCYTDDFGGNPKIQEDRIARRLHGKRVRGSGASIYSKGDVRDILVGTGENKIPLLVECKQTIHESISIKWKWLKKITNEAIGQQAEPALSIEIQGGEDDFSVDRDWIMIPVRVFKQMKELADQAVIND